MRKMLVADLLCGAGGSSTGCARAFAALGLEMGLVCVNHWPTAIETHRRNYPEARHFVQDIATVRPAALVPEGYLDLLMASPTCTHHSVARGGKPTSDQQRSDPWHIITWLTELRVKRIIIENVWEFTSWGPVDPNTGRPIKSRKGEYFNAWINALRALGFYVEWRKLNAADYGDATTRQRFILMGRSDGKDIVWPVPTHHKRDKGLSLFLQPWKAAREIIDWEIRGRSIFDRKKPLARKTLARILAGAEKFGWPEPFIVILRNHMDGKSIHGPLPTIAANGTHIGLAQLVVTPLGTIHAGGGNFGVAEPLILSQQNSGVPRGVDVDPLPTITTGGAGVDKRAGCARHMIMEPFVMSRHAEGSPRSIEEPTPTQVAKHSHVLVAPYYGSGSGETCKSIRDPLDTVTAKARFGIVVPVTHGGGHDRAHSVDDPLSTITCGRRGELAFITAQHGEREGQAPRVHSVEAPAPTIAARGHVDLAQGVVTAVQEGERYDILFRMLEPHELAAAMGFNTDSQAYEFAGTKTQKIRQIGNAVSVAKMKACVGALMADAAPDHVVAANKMIRTPESDAA